MKKLAKTVTASAAALLMAGALTSMAALADNFSENTAPALMGYAPQESFDDGRFGQFDFNAGLVDPGHEHELNDSWLGLSAYSKDGVYVGYVEDAILDENGFVSELVVGTPEGNIAVQLEAKYTKLQNDRVNLTMSSSEFAGIVRHGEIVAMAN